MFICIVLVPQAIVFGMVLRNKKPKHQNDDDAWTPDSEEKIQSDDDTSGMYLNKFPLLYFFHFFLYTTSSSLLQCLLVTIGFELNFHRVDCVSRFQDLYNMLLHEVSELHLF